MGHKSAGEMKASEGAARGGGLLLLLSLPSLFGLDGYSREEDEIFRLTEQAPRR